MTKNNTGFTLLEVVVAITITGLVLGSLFSLLAGSKQLAARTGDKLYQNSKLRQKINQVTLHGLGDIEFPEEIGDHYEIEIGQILETPEVPVSNKSPFSVQVGALLFHLQEYEVKMPSGNDILLKGVRTQVFEAE